jgi:hypothetical protein
VTETIIWLDNVKLAGLGMLIQFNPATATIDCFTLQNRLGWEYLAFELEPTIEIKMWSFKDSIVESLSDARML